MLVVNKAERATKKDKGFREARRQGAEPEGKLLLMVYARFFDYGLHSRAPSTDSEV